MLFKTNKENDDLIEVLSQIRDNLRVGINAEDLSNAVRSLDDKIFDLKKNIYEDFKSTSDFVVDLNKEFKDFKESEFQKKDDEISELKEQVDSMQITLSKVIKINLDLKKRIKKLETEQTIVESDKNQTATEKYIEMRKGTNFSRRYSTGIKYDGFDFITVGGANTGKIICNILELKDLWDNHEVICDNIVNKDVGEKYYANKYNKSVAIFKRVFFNLIATDYFKVHLIRNFCYQYRGNRL